ncbi:MAG: HisA/HisF-related TIM barrel protein [Synergistota bacterium]|nr:HisA/HisF-related TIM barrel protein [Synergistota bacterium]
MNVVPVLDVLDGKVVQGYRGERSLYEPVASDICDTAEPVDVARAVLEVSGGDDIYIADLNALQSNGDNMEYIRNILKETEAELWIDAGTGNLQTASAILVSVPNSSVVIGSETLQTRGDFRAISGNIPESRKIFSLDIKSGSVLTGPSSPFSDLSPEESLSLLEETGWTRVIVLSLDCVGTGTGLPLDLIKKAVSHSPELEIFAGGGCRRPEELEKLASIGAAGTLVATSLHRQWITPPDIARFR